MCSDFKFPSSDLGISPFNSAEVDCIFLNDVTAFSTTISTRRWFHIAVLRSLVGGFKSMSRRLKNRVAGRICDYFVGSEQVHMLR